MNRTPHRRSPLASVVRSGLALAVLAVTAAGVAPQVSTAAGLTGTAGTDTALAPTESAVTLHGRDRFANLTVTVNQTAHLTNQAISVAWSGAAAGKGVANNFLQIFQCWGDDDGTNPANPGPPPQQCEFGGEPITNVVAKIPPESAPSPVFSRSIAKQAWGEPWFDPTAGYFDPQTGNVWMPFHAVDGKSVDAQIKVIPIIDQGVASVNIAWQNPYFDFNTTNEKPWARTYGNGKGAELFQVDTGLEAPGLGCGQKKLAKPDGTTTMPKCWLVVVPRGTSAEENPPAVALADPIHVQTSPLSPRAWANRIAFQLDFNAVDSPCTIGANERRIVGSEFATAAVTSWQPKLCSAPGSPPYAFSAVSDNQARQQISSGTSGAPGLGVVSRPFDPTAVDPSDPVVYAPLTLSGVVIGFNVERVPNDVHGAVLEAAEKEIAATRVGKINLTPRLVAKLLTQSYSAPFYAVGGARPAGYEWLTTAPRDVTTDPDFLQFNPEFTVMSVGNARTSSAVTVEAANSDAARTVWEWILADPEAKAWLDGTPDAWGMKVNPYYATTATANRTGFAFADPVPEAFPKNDPYCFQSPEDNGVLPRPLCLLDVQPYGLSTVAVAQATRGANDGALQTHDDGATHQTANTWWSADGPQPLGKRSILSITDSASAFRYGLQTASLSRAGDDGAARSFVAADDAGFLAGLKAMVPSADRSVLVPDPHATASGAYPLALVTYAAAYPLDLDSTARKDYAAFVELATGAGQTPGVDFGQLPPGYAPLPAELRAQAAATAAIIRSGVVVAETPTTTTTTTAVTTPTTVATTTSVTTSASSSGTRPPTVAGSGTGRSTSASSSSNTVDETSTPDTGTTVAEATTSTDASTSSTVARGTTTTSKPKVAAAPAGKTPAVLTSSFARHAVPAVGGLLLLAAIAIVLLDGRAPRLALAVWTRRRAARARATR